MELDNLKGAWDGNKDMFEKGNAYDKKSFEGLLKGRVKKHTNQAMQYFWASFVLQLTVYALLSHLIVTFWSNALMVGVSLLGICLYIPFTIVLMNKFKAMATTKAADNSADSLYKYVAQRRVLLENFYQFKKRYELMLIPLSSLIGVYLFFKLYIPGGVAMHPTGAIITFGITLLSCAAAIYSENKRNFEGPLHHFRAILDEFNKDVSAA